MTLDYGPEGKFSPGTWTLAKLKAVVNKWQTFMYENDGWNALYVENHDQPRAVSRFAFDDIGSSMASAKLIAVFHAFQAGTPFIYQGQEIGMTNVPKEWPIEEYKDVDCVNHWNSYKDSPDEHLKRQVKAEYQKKSRDNARTPMQWDHSPQAGFTTGNKPWMRVNDNYDEVNAAAQTDKRRSVYHSYRLILEKRKQYKDIFVYGSFELVDEPNDKIFAYKRTATNGESALIVCNFSLDSVQWNMDDKPKEVLFTTSDRKLDFVSGGELSLWPCEAIALLL